MTSEEMAERGELPTDGLLRIIVKGRIVATGARPKSFTDAMLGLHKELWEGFDPNTWLDEERSWKGDQPT